MAIVLSLGTGVTLAADYDSPEAKARQAAKHWAYQPVQSPSAPQVKQAAWVRTPVDAFILAKLEEQNLKPSADADRATFIRRATLDVTGVIPTPEEVKDFVSDKSPNAYEKLVDRLLASPRYGERQGRRWLDLARYSDSTGFQGDQTRRNNFRYRDYVINAFNQDKPYDRFLKEQLAGDELWPNEQDALVATGFLAGYPDNLNSRDLVQRKYQIETDMTDTVGQALLAQTLSCARCHNHKFDKISQKDYFSFQAFFANTAFNEKIPAAKGEQEAAYEEADAKWQAATKTIRARQKEILEPLREKAVKYHKERYLDDSRESIFKAEAQWTPLDRWVNWRLANVSTDRDVANYLRLTAEGKDFPDYNPENIPKWEEYKKLDADLKKYDNLRPSGSKFVTAATEPGPAGAAHLHPLLGHP
ncbi:MAG: DUF1549 domain-containing protein [Magnetospirillum sp.]|nr:DUF1549 domain-containing protein [Magnetospirillum sp.]